MEKGAQEKHANEDLGVLYLCESSLCGSMSAFVFLEYTDPLIRGLQMAYRPVRSSTSEPCVRTIAPGRRRRRRSPRCSCLFEMLQEITGSGMKGCSVRGHERRKRDKQGWPNSERCSAVVSTRVKRGTFIMTFRVVQVYFWISVYCISFPLSLLLSLSLSVIFNYTSQREFHSQVGHT